MSKYTVAIIGTGADPSDPTVEGFAMGYRHAEGFRTHDDCEIVACADLIAENRSSFAETFGIAEERSYEDYEQMLDEVRPDVTSIAVAPQAHEPLVVGCARHDAVSAVHCEKPMADTWASAQRMVQTCWRSNTQLTFNRQRRFAKPFTEAKHLLDDGRIGGLERVEIEWGDFYDTGAHSVDLAGMFSGDRPAEWVIAQLDYRTEDVRFGMHQENQMWAQWEYTNGVRSVLSTGTGSGLTDAAFVLRGTDGTLRIDVEDGPMLELERDGKRTAIDVGGEDTHQTNAEPEGRYGSLLHDRVVDHIIKSLQSGEESVLSGRRGLNTAEILFGGYESVRRRGRLEFPLRISGNPFEEMIETGELSPKHSDEQS